MVRTPPTDIEGVVQLSLNPLKAGQWFGHIEQGRTFCLSYCLNPLKAGQWFGHMKKIEKSEKKVSLNPLKAGQWFGPDTGCSFTIEDVSLNPLKAGQWFGLHSIRVRIEATLKSQSPQSGAMVRTFVQVEEFFLGL